MRALLLSLVFCVGCYSQQFKANEVIYYQGQQVKVLEIRTPFTNEEIDLCRENTHSNLINKRMVTIRYYGSGKIETLPMKVHW